MPLSDKVITVRLFAGSTTTQNMYGLLIFVADLSVCVYLTLILETCTCDTENCKCGAKIKKKIK